MYNAHWIHSLPYSKFIELTLILLFYNKYFCFIISVYYIFLLFRKGYRNYSLKYLKEYMREFSFLNLLIAIMKKAIVTSQYQM